jgi:hypothetical protein
MDMKEIRAAKMPSFVTRSRRTSLAEELTMNRVTRMSMSEGMPFRKRRYNATAPIGINAVWAAEIAGR